MLSKVITLTPGGEVLIHFIRFCHQVLELRRWLRYLFTVVWQKCVVHACGEKTCLQLLDAEEEGTTFVLNFGDCIPGYTCDVAERLNLQHHSCENPEPCR